MIRHALLIGPADGFLHALQIDPFLPEILRTALGTDIGMVGEWISLDPDLADSLGRAFGAAGLAMNEHVADGLVAPDDPFVGLHLHAGTPDAAALVDAEPPGVRRRIVHRVRAEKGRRNPLQVREDLPDAASVAAFHP